MTLDEWFEAARKDAERRGLPALVPLLEMLRHATIALRDTDWGDATDIAGDTREATAPDRKDGRT